MKVTTFEEGEVEVLIRALRYWRARRREGLLRRTDACPSPSTVDLLLAKLEGPAFESLPADSLPPRLHRR
jgi:hypothetical protein